MPEVFAPAAAAQVQPAARLESGLDDKTGDDTGSAEALQTPVKRQRKEKTAEQIAAAEAKKAEKAAEKQKEKAEKAAATQAAKEAKAADKAYAKSFVDDLKSHVQARCKSMVASMTVQQYRYVFADYLHLQCSKKITTESTFGDGHTEVEVREIPGKLYLNERQVQGCLGVGRTKGGSYNGYYGATSWNIKEMTVTPPTLGNSRVVMNWKLSSGADWSK